MKVFRIVGTIFSALGLAFILTGVLFYRNTHTFLTQSETTTGVVTDLVQGSSRSYRLVVRFETPEGDVITFQSNVGSNPPSYRIGEAVKVRYLLEDLHRARIDSFLQLWFLSILFGGMGFVFGSVGGVMFLIAYRSARKERWLLTNGQIIYADFEEIIVDRSIRMQGQNPYRITAQWLDPTSNTVYAFKSKALWYNPEAYIHEKKIPVRIVPKNPKRYFVDTGFLPKSVDS